MRTGKVKIRGKDYITCFSTRVLLALEEREGNSDKALQQILSNGKVTDMFWLLAQMIDAGDRYAKIEGLDNPGTLTFDEIIDSIGVDDYKTMFDALAETVKNGSTPTVQTKPPKNAETTQPEE